MGRNPQPIGKQPVGRPLLEMLHTRLDDVVRFAYDLNVPATNNQAERDLRPAKTQQKISGRLTSETVTQARYRIRGYVSTAAKHSVRRTHRRFRRRLRPGARRGAGPGRLAGRRLPPQHMVFHTRPLRRTHRRPARPRRLGSPSVAKSLSPKRPSTPLNSSATSSTATIPNSPPLPHSSSRPCSNAYRTSSVRLCNCNFRSVFCT